jgi:RNA polymerase sigma-70 factor, ECF subfamily
MGRMQKPLSPEEERTLFERLATDPEVIGEIYDLYAQRVFAFSFKRCGHREIAEDVTSHTFIRLLESAPTLEYRGTRLSSWLFQVASNAIIDHFRKSSTKKEVTIISEDAAAWDPPSNDDPAWNTELAIAGETLLEAIVQLPERDQHVLHLRFFAELEPQEIGDLLGISSNHASVLVYRAVGRLRQRLTKDQHGT